MLPVEAPADYSLRLLVPPAFKDLSIECGDIDGVVLGSWANLDGSGSLESDDDSSHAGYWAAAAVWSNAWDQTTIDRVSCIPFSTNIVLLSCYKCISWCNNAIANTKHKLTVTEKMRLLRSGLR